MSNKTTLFDYTIIKFQFNEYVFPLFFKAIFRQKTYFFSFFIPLSISHFQLIILNGSCVIFTRSTFLQIGTTNFILSVCWLFFYVHVAYQLFQLFFISFLQFTYSKNSWKKFSKKNNNSFLKFFQFILLYSYTSFTGGTSYHCYDFTWVWKNFH